MKLTRLFNDFFDSEKAGGIILVFVTVLSLGLANSPWQTSYVNLWHIDLGGHSIVHWINDGLMTIFFLLIGLELEREIYHGELSDIKNVSLPILAALGGMLVPAGLFLLLNFGTDTQAGAGFLGGIGFTMSIFITLLAFDNADIINNSKIAIILASVLAGIIGFISLKLTLNKQAENIEIS